MLYNTLGSRWYNLHNTFFGIEFFFQPTSHRLFNVFSYGYSDCVFTWNWVIRLQKCAFTGISKTRSFIFRCTILNSITATHKHCVKPQPHWRKNAAAGDKTLLQQWGHTNWQYAAAELSQKTEASFLTSRITFFLMNIEKKKVQRKLTSYFNIAK